MNGTDFTSRNFKRLAEVWLDDYKEVFYEADPKKREIDAGDLTKAKMIRSKLQCKPFDYFLEEIAPEMYTRYFYQKDYPGYFADGLIRSEADTNICLDTMGNYGEKIEVYPCHKLNAGEHIAHQYLLLTWHKKIKAKGAEACLQNNLILDWCRYEDETSFQSWKYDVDTKQLINLWKTNIQCLKFNTSDLTLSMVNCDGTDVSQKWTITNVNEAALRRFDMIRYEKNHFVGMD